MKLKHRIKVNVLDLCQDKQTILTGGDSSFRSRLRNSMKDCGAASLIFLQFTRKMISASLSRTAPKFKHNQTLRKSPSNGVTTA